MILRSHVPTRSLKDEGAVCPCSKRRETSASNCAKLIEQERDSIALMTLPRIRHLHLVVRDGYCLWCLRPFVMRDLLRADQRQRTTRSQTDLLAWTFSPTAKSYRISQRDSDAASQYVAASMIQNWRDEGGSCEDVRLARLRLNVLTVKRTNPRT